MAGSCDSLESSAWGDFALGFEEGDLAPALETRSYLGSTFVMGRFS